MNLNGVLQLCQILSEDDLVRVIPFEQILETTLHLSAVLLTIDDSPGAVGLPVVGLRSFSLSNCGGSQSVHPTPRPRQSPRYSSCWKNVLSSLYRLFWYSYPKACEYRLVRRRVVIALAECLRFSKAAQTQLCTSTADHGGTLHSARLEHCDGNYVSIDCLPLYTATV